MTITRESIIIDNEKNNKILSLIEEVELLQTQFQEQGEELSSSEEKNIQLEEELNIYKKEFGVIEQCSCINFNSNIGLNQINDCSLCKGKGYYFFKKKIAIGKM